MAATASLRTPGTIASPSLVLFLALFASQSGVLVLSPILGDVADDLGVSVAEAGQLRILAAPLAAAVALGAGALLVRFSPRALLLAGSALLALGSLASAAAPTFLALALAQVPMWAGIALLLAAGIAATAAWGDPESRTRLVARALAGPPSAWIVGMPLIGLAATAHWRLAFLVLPLPAALLAAGSLALRPADQPIPGSGASLTCLLRRVRARRWVLGELLANAAWAGTLVFSGALYTEVHGASPTTTGLALAAGAAAYLAGNQWGSRMPAARARRAMLQGSLVAAAAVAITWAVTPSLVVTAALFSLAAVVAAARTVAGTVYGFDVAGGLGREVGVARAATTQAGYLLGSLVGGLALAVGGFPLLAVAFGGLFLASALPHVCLRAPCRFQTAAGSPAA